MVRPEALSGICCERLLVRVLAVEAEEIELQLVIKSLVMGKIESVSA